MKIKTIKFMFKLCHVHNIVIQDSIVLMRHLTASFKDFFVYSTVSDLEFEIIEIRIILKIIQS